MTATDELRKMLDERGVEHMDYKASSWSETTAWDMDKSDPLHEVCAGFEEFSDGATLLRFWNATPAQAIAATLGAGTCKNVAEQPSDNTFWPVPHFKCSECGHKHVSMEYVYFCPNCGRKVIDQDAQDLLDAIASDDGMRYSMSEVMEIMEDGE